MENLNTRQLFLTIPAGRRLIARAVASLDSVKAALENGTIVIVAGTTNSYVAQELLGAVGQLEGFVPHEFYRGVMAGPVRSETGTKRDFSGVKDIVLKKGVWIKGKTILEVAGELGSGDIIIKGANAVSPDRKQAGVQIGVPTVGTTGGIIQASVGRRVEVIIPVGLEKRILGDVWSIAQKVNAPSCTGTRLMPLAGNIITELEALEMLSGVRAELVASGGIYGAEGSYIIAATGTDEQLKSAAAQVREVASEPPFGSV